MSPGKAQRKGITFTELLKMFPDDATVQAWFVEARWPGGAHCGSANVKTGANHHSMPFRCRQKGCAKRFSTRTGTVMECSNPGFQLWAIAVFLLATNLKGISSMKLHRDLGVTRKTAWFLAHRIRETWQDTSAWFAWLPGFHPFDGPIEADETCVGGKRKNMSHEKRKQLRGRGTVGKVAVAGVKDRRTEKVSARVVQHTDSVTLQGFVQHHGTPGATVYTDAAVGNRWKTVGLHMEWARVVWDRKDLQIKEWEGRNASWASTTGSAVLSRSRREKFLSQMEEVVPWSALLSLIVSFYPVQGPQGGRPPYPAETMLRIHLMQNWYCLSDEAMEDALIEVESMRRFAHLDLAKGWIPAPFWRSATSWRNMTWEQSSSRG